MRFSIEPRDRIYVKAYEFLFFAKSIVKNLLRVLKNLQQME